jgi:hypothetical protein
LASCRIGQLPHQSLVHYRLIWLNAKDVVTQIYLANCFTCGVLNFYLHGLSPKRWFCEPSG